MAPIYQLDDLLLVDVGASGGIHRRWNRLLPNLKAILFEPDESAYRKLVSRQESHVQVVKSALFEEPGEYVFHACRTGQLSSVYKPNVNLVNRYPHPERYDIIESHQVSMTSLDRFFEEADSPGPQFIKLDTQGAELPILRGGIQILRQVIGVELEVEYVDLYKNAPLFPEVDEFMRSQGFQLYDACHYFWNQNEPGVAGDSSLGEMIFGEVLYFRSPDSVLKLANQGQVAVDQAIRCYLAYGYTHISEVLASRAAADGLLDQDELRVIRDLIRKFRPSKALSRLPGSNIMRWRLVHLASRLFPWCGWAWKSKAELGSRYSLY